mgnify:CR=1 FL=1
MAGLGLKINLRNRALSQYMNWDFDSMTMFNGKAVGVGPGGVFELWQGDTDNGEDIDARMDLPETDLGTSCNKRLRSLFLGCRADGALRVTVIDDEEKEAVYTAYPLRSNRQGVIKVSAGRNHNKGCYFTLRIENVDGSDFDLDFIDVMPIILNQRPGRF